MQNAETFSRTLGRIEKGIGQMTEQAERIRWSFESGNVRAAYAQALGLAEAAEKTVLLTRVLPACTGHPRAEENMDELIRKTIPVEIGFTGEGWFALRFPALLPKKERGSANYIRAFLYPAMQRFFESEPPLRYQGGVLVIRHVYDRSRPERRMRDHDNIEVNMVSDIVAMYVLPDDSPRFCDHYYCSAAAQEDRTEVYVVPRPEFPAWLTAEQSMPDEGIRLYDTDYGGKKYV